MEAGCCWLAEIGRPIRIPVESLGMKDSVKEGDVSSRLDMIYEDPAAPARGTVGLAVGPLQEARQQPCFH